MAGRSKQYDFIFDGGLNSHTRASLVIELIKYLLYERNQIPLHFDGLKQQTQIEEVHRISGPIGGGKTLLPFVVKVFKYFQKCLPVIQGVFWAVPMNLEWVQNSHINSKYLQTERKAQAILSSLEDLFVNILKAFETCPEIQQALVLLGSTTATPKEVYVVNLPSLCPEANHVSLKSCKQAFFRHIVAEQILANEAALGPTNVMVMLLAPTTAILKGFVPKMSFKVPSRGICLTLNMICMQPHSCQELTFDGSEVEISGIEPLNISSAETLDHSLSATPLSSCSRQHRHTFLKFPVVKMERNHLSTPGSVKAEDFNHVLTNDCEITGSVKELMLPHTASTPKPGHCQQPPNSNCAQQSSSTEIQHQCIWFQYATAIKGYSV